MFSVNYNDQNSYDDIGLIIERRPIVPSPVRRIKQIEIPGRNGNLTEDEGTYDDINIPIEFALIDRDNVYEKARVVRNWLIGGGSLVIGDDQDRFYKVKFIKLSDMERFMIIVGKFTATFVCEPFTYSNIEDSVDITTQTSIFNPGSYESEPYIKISGTGTIDLNINGDPIKLTSVDGYIELDSEMGECYKGYTPVNNQMSGRFPKLQPGENTISWTGSVTNIKITPRWRWL